MKQEKDFIITLLTTDGCNHYIGKQLNEDGDNINGLPICSMLKDIQLYTKEEAEKCCECLNRNIPHVIEIGKGQTLIINGYRIDCIDDPPIVSPSNSLSVYLSRISSPHNYKECEPKLY